MAAYIFVGTGFQALAQSPSPSASTFTIVNCGPAFVDDYGLLYFNSSQLRATAADSTPNDITYRPNNVPDGSVAFPTPPFTFSQNDINNNEASPRVYYQPNAAVLTELGSVKPTTVEFLVNDLGGNSLTCNMPINITYSYAPIIDLSAAPVISTVQFQPVVIDTTIVNVIEQHGLSTWYFNWTSIDSTFNSGAQGRLEYFTLAYGWVPLPMTQPFPHQWIVNKNIRYNPNSFNGTASLKLRLTNNRGIKYTGNSLTVTVGITVTNSTIKGVGTTANPPTAGMSCTDVYPIPFINSYQTPIGPFCVSFMTTGNVPFTYTTPFLGVKLVVTTKGVANVSFGFSIAPPSTAIPAGFYPLSFAGYMDFSAFSISTSPPDMISNAQLTTPELVYDQFYRVGSAPNVSVIMFDPVTGTQTTQFVNTLAKAGPPRITMTLFQAGFYCLVGNSGTGQVTETTQVVSFGNVPFIGAWGKKDFTFPTPRGNLTILVTSANDFVFSISNTTSQRSWVPPNTVMVDSFNITFLSTTPAALTMKLSYTPNAFMLATYKPLEKLAWNSFRRSVDGGEWVTTVASSSVLEDAESSRVEVTVNRTQFGLWAILYQQSSVGRVAASFTNIFVVIAMSSLLLFIF